MTAPLSPNTQAILLLTAPLSTGRARPDVELLTLGGYRKLARRLRDLDREPADLLGFDAGEILRACAEPGDEARLQRLLGRGFTLSQAVEHWRARAIWVVSRADAEYPRRIKVRLKDDAPPILYGCGDAGLLAMGGLAVVGSRSVDETVFDWTMAVGELAAHSGVGIISGGAKGIDQAAMRGALEAGGAVNGVLADSLERTAMIREHRDAVIDKRLTLLSPYDPLAGFNVGHAMQRNKLIYALSDAALVVSSDLGKGGTWTGAVEQLEKLRFVPVYIRDGTDSPGLSSLRGKGAIAWPEPRDVGSLQDTLVRGMAVPDVVDRLAPPEQPSLFGDAAPPVEANGFDAAAELLLAVQRIVERLAQVPVKEADIAAALDMPKAKTKIWLKAFVDSGVLTKINRPERFVAARQQVSANR